MRDTCLTFGVDADRRDGHPGCWVDPDGPRPRKIGALGLRVERGVSYHGIALNVTTDLAAFGLIDPCGMPDVESTSIARELGRSGEPASTVGVEVAGQRFAEALRARLRRRSADGDVGRPVRAAQGRDHRLVGRDRRRPGVPSRSVPAGGRGRRRRRRLPELPGAGR